MDFCTPNIPVAVIKENPVIEPENNVTRSGYRARQTFTGEKFSGGLNYQTAINLNHDALRKRSKRAYIESTQARSAINRITDSAVNVGLKLQSQPIVELLPVTAEVAQEKSKMIQARFKLWADDKNNCDYSCQNTFGQMQRINSNNQNVNGDYFAILHYSTDPLLINPLQVQLIPPDRVQTPYGSEYMEAARKKGRVIRDGIELDDRGREEFVYIRNRKTDGTIGYTQVPFRSKETGRVIVIHGNRQTFGDEVRSVPELSYVVHELEKITDHSVLELNAAVANAAVAMVVTPSDNAPATNPMPHNSFVPPSMISNGSGIVETDTGPVDHGYTNIGKNQFDNAGGLMVSSLNAGEKLDSYDTKRPNVNFINFLDGMTKHLSASLNIPFEILTMMFGSNYSASRGVMLLFWNTINVLRNEATSDFLKPVYDAWLLGEVSIGAITLPGFDTPAYRQAWSNCAWVGIPAPSLDPYKEERAATVRVQQGFKTREQEAQERHNTSFSDNVDKLATENKRLSVANEPLTDEVVVNA